jgi:hypothetical protein
MYIKVETHEDDMMNQTVVMTSSKQAQFIYYAIHIIFLLTALLFKLF